MSAYNERSLFDFWYTQRSAPFHFPMDMEVWSNSMYFDVDSEGRKLFSELETQISPAVPNREEDITGLIQYGYTAFGFDTSGEISPDIHYPVIRFLCFDPAFSRDGQKLLDTAMTYFGRNERIYAFFHYFGMSACGRHGKLHERDKHVETLLLENGFVVEHENVYYSKTLTE